MRLKTEKSAKAVKPKSRLRRGSTMDNAELWMAQHPRWAGMMISLDDGKTIAEAHGVEAAQHCIQTALARTRELLADDAWMRIAAEDRLHVMFRIGPGTEALLERVQQLIERVQQPVSYHGLNLHSCVSIGLAVFPDHGNGHEQIGRRARLALDEARARGLGRHQLFEPQRLIKKVDEWSLAERLRQAAVQNAFHLVYQPCVRSADGRIAAAEALLRWHTGGHPMLPDLFVPVLEKTGLIVEIGDWVLREACRTAAQWRAEGLGEIQMHVNLSPRQFLQGGLAARIAAILDETGLPATQLALEITESEVVDLPRTREFAKAMRQLGVGVVLDDFGVGYSSMSYLCELPVSAIKIDRAFTSQLLSEGQAARVTESLIAFARSLKLQMTVEGVERAAQAGLLHRLGVERLQGFLFSPGVRAADFAVLLRDQPFERVQAANAASFGALSTACGTA